MTLARLIMPDRYRHGRIVWPQTGTIPNRNFGPCFNDWVQNRTSGPGGDYPTGDVWMPAGTYYFNQLDLIGGGYTRAYDPTKPYNNWLRIREYDGPGTVIFDLRPESAATALGQSQTQAYNDTAHGGGFHNVDGHDGSLRWMFDGNFAFNNGNIHFTNQVGILGFPVNGSNILTAPNGTFHSYDVGREIAAGNGIRSGTTITSVDSSGQVHMSLTAYATPNGGNGASLSIINKGVDRVIFHGTSHKFPIDEWRRQFDIIRAILGVADPGTQIPNTSTYTTVWFDSRFAGDTFACGFRLEGATRIGIARANIGPVGDDGIFTGDRCDRICVTGTVIHDVRNDKDANGNSVNYGVMISTNFHNDCWQWTGSLSNSFLYDSTLHGHGVEFVAEVGYVTNFIADRVWQGCAGADGGDLGTNNGYNIDSASHIGSGGPTTRLSGHYYRGFSNGTDHSDTDSQQGYAISGAGAGWHAVLVGYEPQANIGASVSVTVQVPTGVTVDATHGFITSAVSTFLNSTDAPHQKFLAAYALSEGMTVLGDYGISLD